jgi:hypothetical protein
MQFIMIGRDSGIPLIVVESYPRASLFEFDENHSRADRPIFVHFCGRCGHEIRGMAASPNILWILTTHPPSPAGRGAIETDVAGRFLN